MNRYIDTVITKEKLSNYDFCPLILQLACLYCTIVRLTGSNQMQDSALNHDCLMNAKHGVNGFRNNLMSLFPNCAGLTIFGG